MRVGKSEREREREREREGGRTDVLTSRDFRARLFETLT